MIYQTEHAFQTALVKQLRVHKWYVVPIESRTVPGIPDLYCWKGSTAQWIECKMLRRVKDGWFVPFRVGQQAWHLKHRKVHPVMILGYYKGKMYSHKVTKLWEDHVIPFELWEEEGKI